MKIIYVHGWNYFHPEVVEKAEEFIHSWRKEDDNSSYINAEFYGVIAADSEKFEEITEGEDVLIKNVHYLIRCHMVRNWKEVYTTLLRY